MKFTAAGDVLIQQQIPFKPKDFDTIKAYIEKGDARFFNLETTLNYEGECCSNQISGGTYVRTNPESLYDFLKYGFNLTTFNNNHIMDFSYDGLLKTIEYANRAGIKHSGVGRNLGEASAPCYLDTENGRVALISFCVNNVLTNMAGEQTSRVKGRPRMNILRRSEKLIVPAEDFDVIVRIGNNSGINAMNDTVRKEGYLPPLKEGIFDLGTLPFEKGDTYKYVLTPNEEDLARAAREIYEAKLSADYVIISLHCHDQISADKSDVPEFLETVSHFFIDNGANAVIGHGPHLLRAIEVYKDCPIFYSLGDFVLQLYSIAFAPAEFYRKNGLTPQATVHELLKKRSADFTRGLMEDRAMRETVIPYWETDENGRLTHLELLPITLMKEGANKSEWGLPALSEDTAFIEHLDKISRPYGTTVTMENGIAVCRWK